VGGVARPYINQHNTRQIGKQRASIGTAALSMLNTHIKTVHRMIRCVIHRTINPAAIRICDQRGRLVCALRYRGRLSPNFPAAGFLAARCRTSRASSAFSRVSSEIPARSDKSRDKGAPMTSKKRNRPCHDDGEVVFGGIDAESIPAATNG